MLSVIFALLFGATLSQAAFHGETCIPLLRPCEPNSNLRCVQELGDDTTRCHCTSGNTVDREGLRCFGTYEQSCSSGDGCNTDRGLACLDQPVVIPYGHCRCARRPETVFSYVTNTCVGVFGAACDPESTNIWGANCMENAHCEGSSSTCLCDPGYYPANDRRCVQLNGGKPGDVCESDGDCDWENLRLECAPETKTCECARSKSYHAQKNGTCVKDYGAECHASLDICDNERWQRCSSSPGICECKSTAFQLFNPETENCDSIIGRECGKEALYPGIGCIPNADCLLETTATVPGFSYCTCKFGFVPSPDNKMCLQEEK